MSFFVRSPEIGVLFVRLMFVFANIRNNKLDPVEYLCDVYRRINKTLKENYVNWLAQKRQLSCESVWAKSCTVFL